MLTKTFENLKPFEGRRKRLTDRNDEAAFILFSGNEGHLAPFRANSNFVYLTGFEEPEAVAVIRTGKKSQYSLFVRDKDPAIEIWDGERFGPQLAKATFGADQCFAVSELEKQLPTLLEGIQSIYFSMGDNPKNDELLLKVRNQIQLMPRRSGQPKAQIHDPNEVLAPMRMVKDEFEIALIKESCELTAQAHINVMKKAKPGKNEKQSLADFLYGIYMAKAAREGYSSIIASGSNACTLHYRANTRDMEDGDLLLIDAGGEKNYFTADITRTYPVNGKFTEPQRKIYEAVLDVQKSLINMIKPGLSLPELHEKSCEMICQKLIDLGILSGTLAENMESKSFQKYYPHGIGHYLGMDVHDVGFSKIDGEPVPFKAGVVITVEPGIYIPAEDNTVDQSWRGIGVRIEDDVLVTASGCEVLTASAPKEVSELEALIGTN